MSRNLDFDVIASDARRDFKKLVKRFGPEKIQQRADLSAQAALLKRQMFAREAERDEPHKINSAIRTFAPQLAAHKGSAKVNRGLQLSTKLGYAVTK